MLTDINGGRHSLQAGEHIGYLGFWVEKATTLGKTPEGKATN